VAEAEEDVLAVVEAVGHNSVVEAVNLAEVVVD